VRSDGGLRLRLGLGLLTVEDFIAAADHQKRLEGLLAHIRDVYPDAILEMRERRERKAFALPRAPDGA
jgi:hypothetical protein